MGTWNKFITPPLSGASQSSNDRPANFKNLQNSINNSRRRTRRSHRSRRTRLEYMRVLQDNHTGYDVSHRSQEKSKDSPSPLNPIEPTDNSPQREEGEVLANMIDQADAGKIPIPTDPITPIQRKQRTEQTANEPSSVCSTAENVVQPEKLLQIEGHSISAEDHESRAHILYNLPGLDSLPRCSSSSTLYLKLSQKKLRWSSTNLSAEIQSRSLAQLRKE